MTLATPAATTKSVPRFEIFSAKLEAIAPSGEDGVRRFHTTASSNAIDLSGDEITLAALQKMASQAERGMPIFLNHKYELPENVLGFVDSASVEQRGFDANGSPIYDMDLGIQVDEANPRAIQTWNSIEGGKRVGARFGVSIGAKVNHAMKKKSGGYLIDDIQWVEASMVGIPQNRRSWTHYAAKALAAYEEEIEEVPEDIIEYEGAFDGVVAAATDITVGENGTESLVILKSPLSSDERGALPDSAFACPEQRKYPIRNAAGHLDPSHVRNALARLADPGNDQCGKGNVMAAARELGIGNHSKSVEDLMLMESAEFIEWVSAIPDIEKAAGADTSAPLQRQGLCPTCGGEKKSPRGGCESDYHDSETTGDMDNSTRAADIEVPGVAIDKEAARTRVTVTVDSEGGQASTDKVETPETTPAEETDTEPLATEKAAAVSSDDVSALLGSVKKAYEHIAALTEENVELRRELDLSKTARENAEANLTVALEVVNRVKALPLPRKSAYVATEAAKEMNERFPFLDPSIVRRLSD